MVRADLEITGSVGPIGISGEAGHADYASTKSGEPNPTVKDT